MTVTRHEIPSKGIFYVQLGHKSTVIFLEYSVRDRIQNQNDDLDAVLALPLPGQQKPC